MGFVETFQLVATAVFVIGSAIVSGRLLALGRRTGQAPELLLGSAILCTAVLGYGVLIAAMLIRGTADLTADDAPTLVVAMNAIGRFVHDVGVSCFLVFVVWVFRPRDGWAHAVAALALLLLWGGFAVGAALGTLRVERVGSLPWFCEYAVIWTYPLWNVIESYRYWGLMRRRTAIGLADPLVTERFFLWGTGSLFTAIATCTASVPYLYVGDPAGLAAVTPVVRIVTAAAGVVSVTCSLFAFLPPAWYRRRVAARASALQGAH